VKESKKTKILDVAARLFAEKGYSNVSVRDVCREAETTPPMIYYYFGDKRGLFASAVSHRVSLQDFISRLRERTDLKDEVRGISAFIETYLSSFPDRVFDLGLYMLDTAKLDRKSAERISKDLDEIHRIATSIIERGVRSSIFSTTDTSKAADCLIGMLNRVIFQRIHFAKKSDLESSREFITDFFLRAVVIEDSTG
jgi:AcrR family transcriptional regulator